ncbi:hypothetical protein JZ751_029779, partial [Albula glossodonta]
MDDFDMLSAPQPAAGNGVGAEEDPAAAFLAQQESEIAGIENDEGFSILDSGEVPASLSNNLTGEQDANGPKLARSRPPAEDARIVLVCPDILFSLLPPPLMAFERPFRRRCWTALVIEIPGFLLQLSSARSQVPEFEDVVDGALNGEVHEESNGPSDAYAAISNADRLHAEPESLRKWREEQQERLEALGDAAWLDAAAEAGGSEYVNRGLLILDQRCLSGTFSDANSRTQEAEWKEKAKAELEEWNTRQNEQLEKTKSNNRVLDEDFYKQPFSELIGYVAAEEAMVSEMDENNPGTEWERVARLCDFNPKSSKQAKDVSRMRSVLISLKQKRRSPVSQRDTLSQPGFSHEPDPPADGSKQTQIPPNAATENKPGCFLKNVLIFQ